MSRSASVAAYPKVGVLDRVFKKVMPNGSVLLSEKPERRGFQIESVHTFVHRQSANQLLQERYAWRGYQSVSLPAGLSGNHFSLSATRERKTIGTMTVGFEQVYLMQNNINLIKSEIISTFVYKIGLLQMEYSFSTAVGLFNSVVNLLLLSTVNFLARKLSETSLW